jgi:hypothetical protein
MEERSGTAKFPANARVRVTYGEIRPDGTVIDLVAGADRDELNLLHSDGKGAPSIGPAVDCGDVIYQRPILHETLLEAIPFPRGLASYGTIAQLFLRACNLYEKHLRWPKDPAALKTAWDFATWVPELMPSSPTLCVLGATMRQVSNLFRMSGALCRRGLRVAKLGHQLPFFLRPTLLVTDPKLMFNDCAFWTAAGFRGVFTAGPAGTVCELSGAKAVLLYEQDHLDAWGEAALPLICPPIEGPDLGDRLLAEIATEFQPQLQQYRLDLLHNRTEFVAKSSPRSLIALDLFACVGGEPDIVQILTPLLQSREKELLERRSRDPRVAVLEGVWTPSHDCDEITVDEITNRVNAILRSRGVKEESNSRKIGWQLRNLNLRTSSNGRRKVLRFWSETRSRIHQNVRDLRLQLPFREDCVDCRALQATKDKPVE